MTKVNNSSQVQKAQQKAQNSKKITTKELAIKFFELAEEYAGAIDKPEFQQRLEQLKRHKHLIVDFLKQYNAQHPDESFIEMIGDEVGTKAEIRKQVILEVFHLLLEEASKYEGIPVVQYNTDFNKALDKEFNGYTWNGINADKLDEIVNNLIFAIDFYKNLTPQDKANIQNTDSNTGMKETIESLNTIRNQASNTLTKIKDNTGWAGRLLDELNRGSAKTYNNIEKDLDKYKTQLEELDAARQKGTKEFNNKFKEIFGVNYNYTNIVAFKRAEQSFVDASIKVAISENYNKQFKYLLLNDELKEDKEVVTVSSPTCNIQSTVPISKEAVYEREFNKIAKLFNDEGKDNGAEKLNAMLEKFGVKDASIEEKYRVLHQIIKTNAEKFENDAKKALSGRKIEDLEADYNSAYKSAFGTKNNMMKRVADYGNFQQVGSGIIKGVTIAALAIGSSMLLGPSGTELSAPLAEAVVAGELTAGEITAGGLALGGILGGASSFAVEVSDKLSQPEIQKAFKNGVAEGMTKMELGKIFDNAVITGLTITALGGVSHGVTVLTEGLTPVAQAAARFGVNMALLEGMEYAMTGEVSVGGFVFNVLLSATGEIVAMQAKSAASKADEHKMQAALRNARKTLGLAEDGPLTEDLLRKAYRSAVSQTHPDKGGSTEGFIKISEAYSLLKAHLYSELPQTPVKPQTPAPSGSSSENLPAIIDNTSVPKASTISITRAPATRTTTPSPETFIVGGVESPVTPELQAVLSEKPSSIMKPAQANTFSKNDGITFKPKVVADATPTELFRIKWCDTIEETINANKENGIPLELVKDENGNYYLGIKHSWDNGYFRVDRESFIAKYAEDDFAVVAEDNGARIASQTYIDTDTGKPVDLSAVEPGKSIQAVKNPDSTIGCVAFDKPQNVVSLEGPMKGVDFVRTDVDGHPYGSFVELKKHIINGRVVANENDPLSQQFIDLILAGKDDDAMALIKKATVQPTNEPATPSKNSISDLWTRLNAATEVDEIREIYNELKNIVKQSGRNSETDELLQGITEKRQQIEANRGDVVNQLDLNNTPKTNGQKSIELRSKTADYYRAMTTEDLIKEYWEIKELDASALRYRTNQGTWESKYYKNICAIENELKNRHIKPEDINYEPIPEPVPEDEVEILDVMPEPEPVPEEEIEILDVMPEPEPVLEDEVEILDVMPEPEPVLEDEVEILDVTLDDKGDIVAFTRQINRTTISNEEINKFNLQEGTVRCINDNYTWTYESKGVDFILYSNDSEISIIAYDEVPEAELREHNLPSGTTRAIKSDGTWEYSNPEYDVIAVETNEQNIIIEENEFWKQQQDDSDMYNQIFYNSMLMFPDDMPPLDI